MEYDYYALTDIGKLRETNEDNTFCKRNQFDEILLLLLDGMGGQNKGDVASKLTIEFVRKKFDIRKKPFKSEKDMKRWFNSVLFEANKYICDISAFSSSNKGMGTTLVGVLLSEKFGVLANVGDSRCYLLKDGKLVQVTKDDTYANYLLDSGKISQEEYEKYDKKNILTNAIGAYDSFSCKVDVLSPFDSLLLCSDGLYNMIKYEEIEKIMNSSCDLVTKCRHLIDSANRKGGKDNIGVLICEVIK